MVDSGEAQVFVFASIAGQEAFDTAACGGIVKGQIRVSCADAARSLEKTLNEIVSERTQKSWPRLACSPTKANFQISQSVFQV